MIFPFFKKKPISEVDGWWGNLEKAKEQKLISEKEFWELGIERAKKELEELKKKEK